MNESLKCELAIKDLPKTLDELMNMCIRLDDYMHEYRGKSGCFWAKSPPWEWRSMRARRQMRRSQCSLDGPVSARQVREEDVGLVRVLPVARKVILLTRGPHREKGVAQIVPSVNHIYLPSSH